MNEQESVKPLARLIDKFMFLGRTRFSGKIHDNVLNILDQMELDEQKNIVRGLINLYLFSASKEVFSPDISDMAVMPTAVTVLNPSCPAPAPLPAPPTPENPVKVAANDPDASALAAEAHAKKQLTLVLCLGASITLIVLCVTLMVVLLGDGPESIKPIETIMKYSATLMPFFK